jgi:hypothetical protein
MMQRPDAETLCHTVIMHLILYKVPAAWLGSLLRTKQHRSEKFSIMGESSCYLFFNLSRECVCERARTFTLAFRTLLLLETVISNYTKNSRRV